MVPTGAIPVVTNESQVTPELIKEVCESAKSASDKLKALRVLTEPSVHAFISAGGIGLIAEWLSGAVAVGETGIILACLGCLEKLPMTTEILRESKIGKIVTEQLKMCSNQVAVERARKLINTWKALAVPIVPSGICHENVIPAKKAVGAPLPPKEVVEEEATPPSPKRARTEDQVVELVESDDEDEHDKTEGAVSALASLLDNLPDIESIATVDEVVQPRKKGIKWRPDNELVQMVEFAITETCLDLRRTIEETHGGLSSLHPHGMDTDEEHGKFIESRRKERAMAGKGLAGHMAYADMDDEIDVSVYISEYRFPPPIHVYEIQATFLEKNLKSYEKQDLADLHAARKEVFYDGNIPETPGEPSTSTKFYTSMNTTATTRDIFPSGIREYLEDAAKSTSSSQLVLPGTPVASRPGVEAPKPTLPRLEIVTFEDEFVKLDSKLQTAIMGSRDLLKLFSQEPILLRDMTLDKINLVLNNLKRSAQPESTGGSFPPPQQSHAPKMPRPIGAPHQTGPPMMDDRRSWGVSTIKSSVRSQVFSTGVGVPPPPQQPAFPSQQHMFPPQQLGFPPHQHGLPPQQHGFPPKQQPWQTGFPAPDEYYRPPPQSRPGYTGQPGQHQYQQRRGPSR